MNRPRWQKVFTDLWGNRTRSLLVVSSITVGLFAIGIIVTIYSIIAQDMRAAYSQVNAANIYIRASLFDEDLLAYLARQPGVRQVEGVRLVDLRVRDGKDEWQPVDIRAFQHLDPLEINQVYLKQGVWPPRDGEIVVDQYKFPELGANLGGEIIIELPSSKTRALTLVGVVQDLTVGAFSGGGGFFQAPVQGYITQDTLDLLEQDHPEQYSGVFATVTGDAGDEDWVRTVAAGLSQSMENAGAPVSSRTTRSAYEHPNAYLVNAIVGVLFVLGLLVVFLSGFLITITLQTLLNQQVQQIGIMKTVGARRVQIAGIYVVLIFFFGVLAFALAWPLAHRVSFTLLSFLAGKLNFVLQGERVVPLVMTLQALLALVMPQLAAWLPIWYGTRISIQEALSGIRPTAGGGEQAQGGSTRRGRLVSRPLLISVRNTFRRKGRLALTLLTLTLGGAVFISTFNVQVSMGNYIDQISRYLLADVNFSLDRPYRIVEIEQILAQVPGIKRVEGWASARSEIVSDDGSAGDRVQLLAPPADSQLVSPVLLDGRWVQPGDGNTVALSELFLIYFSDIQVGDTTRLNVNGRDSDWVVVGFFQFAGKNGGFSAYTTYEYLSGLTGTPYKASPFQVVAAQAGLSAAEQTRLGQAIEAAMQANGIRVVDVTTSSYLTSIAGGGFAILTAFLLFLAVLTALVGSIGLAGTMSMNVMERTREIGVMRAIGASDRMLMQLVLVEGLIIGGISYVLGELLSFPISKVMADGISQAIFDAPSNFGFTITGFAIWLAVVLVLSFLASVIPARSASRQTIREVLAYE